jgi:hypothetical protein
MHFEDIAVVQGRNTDRAGDVVALSTAGKRPRILAVTVDVDGKGKIWASA